MLPHILLVNPPIYDFSAYDFWLKPYGLLRVAGHLRHQAHLELFDFLDRCHPAAQHSRNDVWGRGRFLQEEILKPALFDAIPRTYYRFGLPRTLFQRRLQEMVPPDAVLIQTVMTYWYLGVRETIEDIRTYAPNTKIILGGVYATLCPDHARSLDVDLVIEGTDLTPLWATLQVQADNDSLPYWEGYNRLETGVVKLTEGCPFRCTYCSVPQIYPRFSGHLKRALAEIHFLCQRGAQRIAFYDDALLFKEKVLLLPLLEDLMQYHPNLELHTPNALNARFITSEVAHMMVRAGFRTFYLGFESSAYEWQKKTGGKVYSSELTEAIQHLVQAGADLKQITAYLIIAHPQDDQQAVEASMHFAHSLGIRLMLSEFSPIPGTPDGEACRRWVNLDEPLWHNKTAFPLISLGPSKINQLKTRARELNQSLPTMAS